MDLSIYDIILGPVVTDKAYRMNRELKKLVFRIHPQANKPLVKQALKKLFDVETEKVRILVRKGKERRVGRRVVQGSSEKRAFVTLAEGYSLDLFDQAGSGVVTGDQSLSSEKKS